ncbi:hypothetical protein GJAV_G00218920 [Gymnothorax javanicus]|nr:hypothetical protein GJAV_G00218920 [Gymnothorax javanicus]
MIQWSASPSASAINLVSPSGHSRQPGAPPSGTSSKSVARAVWLRLQQLVCHLLVARAVSLLPQRYKLSVLGVMRQLWVTLMFFLASSYGESKGGQRIMIKCWRLPGRLRQVDAGQGKVYGIGLDYVPKRLVSRCWSPLDGYMKHITVGPAGVWATDLKNNFYELEEDTWKQVPGKLAQVDAGGTGFLAGVKDCHLAFCADVVESSADFGWTLIPGKLRYYSCGPQSCWGVGEAGEVYVRTGVRSDDCVGKTVTVDSKVCMTKVEVGSDGSVFALSSAGVPYERIGISDCNPQGTGWVRLRGVEPIRSLSYDRYTLWLPEHPQNIPGPSPYFSMESEGCTVTVGGLPTDMEEDRLVDKLCIHFLRRKHGGGEISSIDIIKTTPGTAVITFEDCKVAKRVVEYQKHILLVDGKEYKLTVSFPSKEFDQDKVVVRMTVTVDCKWLPQGKKAITSLVQGSSEVQCKFDQPFWTLDETRVGSSGTRRIQDTLAEDDDHSLLVDMDTFRYIQKNYREEYEGILWRNGAEVVDVTTGGVTALILKARLGKPGGLREAYQELRILCQDTESLLFREQLLKESAPQEGLQQALDVVQGQLPQVVLGEDHKHISIVGSKSAVMEAKQCLLDLRAEEEAGLYSQLGGVSLGGAPKASQLDADTGKILASRFEGGKEWRLAARFKEPENRVFGLDKLGTEHASTLLTPSGAYKEQSYSFSDFLGSSRGLSAVQTLGKDRSRVIDGGLNLEGQKKLGTAGNEIPSRKFESLSAASLEYRPFLSSALIGSRLPSEKSVVESSLSTVRDMDLLGDKKVQSAISPQSESGSKTPLRRANSFSGHAWKKQDQKVNDASVYRDKQSNVNVGTTGVKREEQMMRSVEVRAPTFMWDYMKEAYNNRLKDMVLGSQMKESQSDSGFTTVILRGTDPSRLDSCQRELKNLVTMVASDFDVQELPLTRLGVADALDETLNMCCDEVRRKFQKVIIQPQKESLTVIGPKQLCTQVVGALEEVFTDGVGRRKRQGKSPVDCTDTSDTTLTTNNQNKKKLLPPQTDQLNQSSSLDPLFGSKEEPETQRIENIRPSTSKHKQNVQKEIKILPQKAEDRGATATWDRGPHKTGPGVGNSRYRFRTLRTSASRL